MLLQTSIENLLENKVILQEIINKNLLPLYLYNYDDIIDSAQKLSDNIRHKKKLLCYAVKANSNLAVIKAIASCGYGADVVSQGEMLRALKAGISGRDVVFAGVGKTAMEIKYAIEKEIKFFNIESIAELKRINDIASSLSKKANISLRINPHVDAITNNNITTGRKGDKFGLDIDNIDEVLSLVQTLDSVNLVALSTHIGSQITSLEPFEKSYHKMLELYQQLKKNDINIKSLDLGGGVGIEYLPGQQMITLQQYGKLVSDIFKNHAELELIMEPGRAIVGNAGFIISKIEYVKHTSYKNFAIIDAAMNDLMRPCLYSGKHFMLPLTNELETKYNLENFMQEYKKSQNIEQSITTIQHSSTNNNVNNKEKDSRDNDSNDDSNNYDNNSDDNNSADIYDVVGPVCETTDCLAKNVYIPNAKSGDILIIASCGAYSSSMASEYNSRPLLTEILLTKSKYFTIREKMSYQEMLNRDIIPDFMK